MRKEWASYLMFLSIVANLFLGFQLYSRDLTLNRSTWGYAVNELWKGINRASLSFSPHRDGRVTSEAAGLRQALEDLEALQYLPFYQQRARFEDVNTLRHFLRYAERAHALALKEQGDTGSISPESVARLEKIHAGLEMTLRGQRRTNELTNASYPWNHAAWRRMWREIAEELRKMDFVPLPE